MVWNDAYTKSQAHLLQGNVVSITGRLRLQDEGPRLTGDEVKPLKKPAPREAPVVLRFDSNTSEADLLAVREAIQSNPGTRKVELVFRSPDGKTLKLLPADEFRVNWNEDLKSRLEPWSSP
jgi:hypothetical protein